MEGACYHEMVVEWGTLVILGAHSQWWGTGCCLSIMVVVGGGGCWSLLGDGAGGGWLLFVGTVAGCSMLLVAGAGVCTWVVVIVQGWWWWAAMVQWWPLSLRVVVAGHLWVVGVGALVFVWGQGCYCMVVGGHPQLVCRCSHPFICHIAGSNMAPGKGAVSTRGLFN